MFSGCVWYLQFVFDCLCCVCDFVVCAVLMLLKFVGLIVNSVVH